MTVKAFIPCGLLYLRRRYTMRLLTALCKMFAKWGVKPLAGSVLKSPCFTRHALFLSKNLYTCCYAPYALQL
jgi:hypothetical protein